MGRLASGVSHELSTPLATLLTTLSTLNAELAGSASTRPLLDDARVAAERMQHVLSEMKVWIRDGSDKPTLLLLDPRSVIEQAVERSRSLIEPAAKLTVELGTLVPVSGVASRLVLVLTNLLTNAVGALAHTTNGEVRVVAHADADRVRISVSDTGSGIAPEVLPHIFDPFFSTRESGGMGIGLAMCERIIHDHDGVITVETEVGKGTTFHVDLPAAAPVVTAPQSTPTRQRVLIIEDDDAFSRSLQRLLRVRCDVTIAENGLVALAELKKPGEWDLVLCDLMMPMMNGLELYEQLLLIAPKLAAQLVFISAGGTTEATRAFLARVPNRQLQKPFEVAALFRLLDERLTRPS
jgi:CheY-like chemotaxis protein